jgi:hypothetical protein
MLSPRRAPPRLVADSAELRSQYTTSWFSSPTHFTQTAFLAVRCAREYQYFQAQGARGLGRVLWARLCGGLRRRRGLPKPVRWV